MDFLSLLALIAGVSMALSNIPQSIKIFKRKSAKDISVISVLIILFGSIIWFIYGISIKNTAVIISNGIGILSVSFVLIGWKLYK